MDSACEILDLSSSELYIASQRVTSLANQENKSKLISASKNVLQGTMKVSVVLYIKPTKFYFLKFKKNIYIVLYIERDSKN